MKPHIFRIKTEEMQYFALKHLKFFHQYSVMNYKFKQLPLHILKLYHNQKILHKSQNLNDLKYAEEAV